MTVRKLTAQEREELAADSRRISRAMVELDTPSYEAALEMSINEMLGVFSERGIEIDLAFVRELVRTSLSQNTLASFDALPRFDAARTAHEEAAAQKTIEKAVAVVTRIAIREAGQAALFGADERAEDDQWYLWAGVGDGCETCVSRHGTVFRRDYWEGIEPGTPGSTDCGVNCRCRLFPCSAPPRGGEGLRRDA